MSSDDKQHQIGSTDIGILRDVLRCTGFQYEDPMGELDRNAARYAMELYQQGNKKPEDLIAAISLWAEHVSESRDHDRALEGGI